MKVPEASDREDPRRFQCASEILEFGSNFHTGFGNLELAEIEPKLGKWTLDSGRPKMAV